MALWRNKLCELAIQLHSPCALAYARLGMHLYRGTRKDLIQHQQQEIQKLLKYAAEHTAYYREVFQGKELSLKTVPILTKNILRERFGDLCSDETVLRHAYENTSGGSTGEPVRFLQDREYFDKNVGNKILYGLLNNKYPGDKEIKLWGSERDILQGSIGWKEKLTNYLYNRILLNSFVMSPEDMKNYLAIINKQKPQQIWAYADSIYALAQYAIENDICMYNPPCIMTTAGVLYDDMRKTIQKCFPQSYICNQYGSREVGAIGTEVAGLSGIRVFDHAVYLEVVDEVTGDIRQEGTGRILVTCLTNYVMPLIRFDIGDIGTLTKDVKEREGAFSILEELHGRVNSHIKRKDGSLIHGEYFTHLFYGKQWIKLFQVIQEDYDRFTFRIVIKEKMRPEKIDLEQIENDAKAVVPEAKISIEYVEEIPRLQSGKYQFVISKV